MSNWDLEAGINLILSMDSPGMGPMGDNPPPPVDNYIPQEPFPPLPGNDMPGEEDYQNLLDGPYGDPYADPNYVTERPTLSDEQKKYAKSLELKNDEVTEGGWIEYITWPIIAPFKYLWATITFQKTTGQLFINEVQSAKYNNTLQIKIENDSLENLIKEFNHASEQP